MDTLGFIALAALFLAGVYVAYHSGYHAGHQAGILRDIAETEAIWQSELAKLPRLLKKRGDEAGEDVGKDRGKDRATGRYAASYPSLFSSPSGYGGVDTAPRGMIQKKIADMRPGESGWTVPWAMEITPLGVAYIDPQHSIHDEPGGTVSMLVLREERGFSVDVSHVYSDHKWRGIPCRNDTFSVPVQRIIGKEGYDEASRES